MLYLHSLEKDPVPSVSARATSVGALQTRSARETVRKRRIPMQVESVRPMSPSVLVINFISSILSPINAKAPAHHLYLLALTLPIVRNAPASPLQLGTRHPKDAKEIV